MDRLFTFLLATLLILVVIIAFLMVGTQMLLAERSNQCLVLGYPEARTLGIHHGYETYCIRFEGGTQWAIPLSSFKQEGGE